MSGRGAQGAQPGNPAKAGRGGGGEGKQQQRKGPPHRFIPRTRFEGRCTELKGHIYDLKPIGQSDNFMKTTREIGLYVGRTYSDGSDIKLAVETLEMPTFVMPADPPDDAGRGVVLAWENRVKAHSKRLLNYESNVKTLFSLVWGQCTEALQAKVEADTNYNNMAKVPQDGIQLLKIIKDIAFDYQSQKYLAHAISDAVFKFWTFQQGNLPTTEYYERFKNHLKVLEHVGANIADHPGLIKSEAFDPDDPTDIEIKKSKEKFIATTFILKSDPNRFRKLVEDYENENLEGNNSSRAPRGPRRRPPGACRRGACGSRHRPRGRRCRARRAWARGRGRRWSPRAACRWPSSRHGVGCPCVRCRR